MASHSQPSELETRPQRRATTKVQNYNLSHLSRESARLKGIYHLTAGKKSKSKARASSKARALFGTVSNPSGSTRLFGSGIASVGDIAPTRRSSSNIPHTYTAPDPIDHRTHSYDSPTKQRRMTAKDYTHVKPEREDLEGDLRLLGVEDTEESPMPFFFDDTTLGPQGFAQQFLDNHPDLYDLSAKRWTRLYDQTSENEIYEPFLAIHEEILEFFGLSSTRLIVDSTKTVVDHGKMKTKPDFLSGIRVLDDTKNNPVFHPFGGYLDTRNANLYAGSAYEAKAEKDLNELKDEWQLISYLYHIKIAQKNRRFVLGCLFTQTRFRLYLLDQAGFVKSQWINLHERPIDFVCLLLLLSASDEQVLGFDPDHYWRDGIRYIRVDGTEYRCLPSGISSPNPIWWRETLRGRGTCCYHATKDDQAVLIKLSWKTNRRRRSEIEHLEEARGLQGVGQLIAGHSSYHLSTHRFSKPRMDLNGTYLDRSYQAIVLEKYGPSIDHFTTPEELLYAFRDAVTGHRNLFMVAGILHRDVSTNNILLGNSSIEGWRGVLIDLDHAIKWTEAHTLRGLDDVLIDFRTGTPRFQSVAVLRSPQYQDVCPPIHDHWDDLESFFWVLFCICHDKVEGCTTMKEWDRELDYNNMARLKREVLSNGAKMSTAEFDDIEEGFYGGGLVGETFAALLSELCKVLEPIVDQKNPKIFRKHRKGKEINIELEKETIRAKAGDDYAVFLACVDRAILALQSNNESLSPIPPISASPRATHSSTSQKRPPHRLTPTPSPPAKRPRLEPSLRSPKLSSEYKNELSKVSTGLAHTASYRVLGSREASQSGILTTRTFKGEVKDIDTVERDASIDGNSKYPEDNEDMGSPDIESFEVGPSINSAP